MAPSSSTSLLSRALIVFGIIFLALPVLNRIWLHRPRSDGSPVGDVRGLYFTAIVLTLLARPLSHELTPA